MTEYPGNLPLRSTNWLAANLNAPETRIYDCTAYLLPDPETVFRVQSGRDEWAMNTFLEPAILIWEKDISDPISPLRFTMPARSDFAAAMAALGVGDDTQVILLQCYPLYVGNTRPMDADGHRIYQCLPARRRVAEMACRKRPVTSAITFYPPGSLSVSSAPPHFVARDAVLSAIETRNALLVNALPPEQFRGDPNTIHHGRPGPYRLEHQYSGEHTVGSLRPVFCAPMTSLPKSSHQPGFRAINRSFAIAVVAFRPPVLPLPSK